MSMDPLLQCRLVALALLLASTFALVRRMRRGTLFTASGGLHMNVFLFFGVGGLAYTLSVGWPLDFDPYDDVIREMTRVGLCLLIGYVIWIVLESRLNRRRGKQSEQIIETPIVDRNSLFLIIALWLLSAIGRFGSDSAFAQSGIGTIFPVLRMFQYPIIALAIGMINRRKPYTFLFLTAVIALSAYQAFFSPWRSDLILLGGAVSMGMILRRRRLIIWAQILVIFSLLFLLPFANQKKIHYDEVIADPVGSFGATLQTPPQERVDFVTDFWAVRINGLREAAFVSKALEDGDISYRYGLTYWEAIQQLVPRALWPAKPSFNQTTNYDLSRQIGLLSWTDESTSWGVNFYAEAIWNIGKGGLLLFVPSLFFLVGTLDRVILRRMKHPLLRWLLPGALFFMFIDCVGLVNMGTYLLWILIVGVAIERGLRHVATRNNHLPRRLVTPEVIRG